MNYTARRLNCLNVVIQNNALPCDNYVILYPLYCICIDDHNKGDAG